jgi:hypothetical protein
VDTKAVSVRSKCDLIEYKSWHGCLGAIRQQVDAPRSFVKEGRSDIARGLPESRWHLVDSAWPVQGDHRCCVFKH